VCHVPEESKRDQFLYRYAVQRLKSLFSVKVKVTYRSVYVTASLGVSQPIVTNRQVSQTLRTSEPGVGMPAWKFVGVAVEGLGCCNIAPLRGGEGPSRVVFLSCVAASNKMLSASFPVETTVRRTDSATPGDDGDSSWT
jgi:hypothetical protein